MSRIAITYKDGARSRLPVREAHFQVSAGNADVDADSYDEYAAWCKGRGIKPAKPKASKPKYSYKKADKAGEVTENGDS